MFETHVFRLPMAHPGDVSALAFLLDNAVLQPEEIVAVIGKTEGNGGVNDFTRGYFTQSLMFLLGRKLQADPAELAERVPCVLSGGTEGVLSPHYLVFVRVPASGPAHPRGGLAIGTRLGSALPPEALGRVAQVEDVAATVLGAMSDAGLQPAGVRFVQVKMPCLTLARIEDALSRGANPVTRDPNRAMALARAAGALGVALALGEVPRERIADATLLTELDLFSTRASVSSGVEVTRPEVIVLGNAAGWGGRLAVACRPMADALDIGAVHAVLKDLDISSCPQVGSNDAARIRGVLVKGEPDRRGRIRGHRHTMLEDTDINAQRHLRGALGGMVAAVVGDGRIFVSGGAEHQGPDGGGLIAVIAEQS
jgi:cyanuric acid amidohydrolase